MASGEMLYCTFISNSCREGGLLKSLSNAGIRIVTAKPDLVLLGEGHEFSLDKVHQAVNMILAGARFIATNRDPSPRRVGWNNLGIAFTAAISKRSAAVNLL